MSIHINGYKIKAKNFEEMDKFLKQLRKKVSKIQKELYLSNVSEQITFMLDKKTLYPKTEILSLSEIRRDYEKRQKEVFATRQRDPEIDLSFSLAWFYYEKEFYAILYVEQEEIIKAFSKHKLVQDFSYYDHSDPPRGINEKKFKERRDIWDKIIPTGIPENHCYSLDIKPNRVDFLRYGKKEEYYLYQPSLDSRAEELLMTKLLNEKMKPDFDFSQFIEIRNEVFNPNPEIKNQLKEIKALIKKKYLKKDFLI